MIQEIKESKMAIKVPHEYKQMEYRDLLVMLAKMFRPHVYVELGVKNCYTFNAMLPYVDEAYGCDIIPVAQSNYPESQFTTWHHHQMSTKEFVKYWGKEYKVKWIDFLFIDADHRKEVVLRDFENFFPYVRESTGLIFLHDTYPIRKELLADGYCSNAWKAANWLAENRGNYLNQWEIVTLPGPWAGLSIIRKTNDHHGWMDKGE